MSKIQILFKHLNGTKTNNFQNHDALISTSKLTKTALSISLNP